MNDAEILFERVEPPSPEAAVVEVKDPDFDLLLNLAGEDISLWEHVCVGDDVNVYQKVTANSPVLLLKTIAHIENAGP